MGATPSSGSWTRLVLRVVGAADTSVGSEAEGPRVSRARALSSPQALAHGSSRIITAKPFPQEQCRARRGPPSALPRRRRQRGAPSEDSSPTPGRRPPRARVPEPAPCAPILCAPAPPPSAAPSAPATPSTLSPPLSLRLRREGANNIRLASPTRRETLVLVKAALNLPTSLGKTLAILRCEHKVSVLHS